MFARFKKAVAASKIRRASVNSDSSDSSGPSAEANDLRSAAKGIKWEISMKQLELSNIMRKIEFAETQRSKNHSKWVERHEITAGKVTANADGDSYYPTELVRCSEKVHTYGCKNCWIHNEEIVKLGERKRHVTEHLEILNGKLQEALDQWMKADPRCKHSLWARGKPYAIDSGTRSPPLPFKCDMSFLPHEFQMEEGKLELLREFLETLELVGEHNAEIDKELYA